MRIPLKLHGNLTPFHSLVLYDNHVTTQFFHIIFFRYLYVNLCAHRVQKRESDVLDTEIQAVHELAYVCAGV